MLIEDPLYDSWGGAGPAAATTLASAGTSAGVEGTPHGRPSQPPTWPPNRSVSIKSDGSSRGSSRLGPAGEDPDDTLAEQPHADDEDRALQHGDPGAEAGGVVLHGADHRGADKGP